MRDYDEQAAQANERDHAAVASASQALRALGATVTPDHTPGMRDGGLMVVTDLATERVREVLTAHPRCDLTERDGELVLGTRPWSETEADFG